MSRNELGRAFAHLAAVARPGLAATGARTSAASLLCGLYAVECGLKLILLGLRGIYTTAKLADDDLTHDLNRLLDLVGQRRRFTPSQIAELPYDQQVSPDEIHQLYRYGGRIPEPAERALAATLLELFDTLRENLP